MSNVQASSGARRNKKMWIAKTAGKGYGEQRLRLHKLTAASKHIGWLLWGAWAACPIFPSCTTTHGMKGPSALPSPAASHWWWLWTGRARRRGSSIHYSSSRRRTLRSILSTQALSCIMWRRQGHRRLRNGKAMRIWRPKRAARSCRAPRTIGRFQNPAKLIPFVPLAVLPHRLPEILLLLPPKWPEAGPSARRRCHPSLLLSLFFPVYPPPPRPLPQLQPRGITHHCWGSSSSSPSACTVTWRTVPMCPPLAKGSSGCPLHLARSRTGHGAYSPRAGPRVCALGLRFG